MIIDILATVGVIVIVVAIGLMALKAFLAGMRVKDDLSELGHDEHKVDESPRS